MRLGTLERANLLGICRCAELWCIGEVQEWQGSARFNVCALGLPAAGEGRGSNFGAGIGLVSLCGMRSEQWAVARDSQSLKELVASRYVGYLWQSNRTVVATRH